MVRIISTIIAFCEYIGHVLLKLYVSVSALQMHFFYLLIKIDRTLLCLIQILFASSLQLKLCTHLLS